MSQTPRASSGYPQRSTHFDSESGWDNPELTPLDFSKAYGASSAAAGRNSGGEGRKSSDSHGVINNKEHQIQHSEMEELKKENDMLREIEIQFWALLNEREELQEELTAVRGGNTAAPGGCTRSSPQRGTTATTTVRRTLEGGADRTQELEAECAKMREESDQLHSALEECMELLMLKDKAEALSGGAGVGATSPSGASMSANVLLQQHGPVASFLTWLALENDRANVRGALEGVLDGGGGKLGAGRSGLTAVAEVGAGGSGSPPGRNSHHHYSPSHHTVNTVGISEAERQALHTELLVTKREVKELQEELDRTDMSRLQALDDASRLQKQIEVLSSNVTELRGAYAQIKARADRSDQDTKVINHLKAQLADSVAEASEAKAQLAQSRQMQMVGATSLAADAARIRGELMSRERSRTRSEEPSSAPAYDGKV